MEKTRSLVIAAALALATLGVSSAAFAGSKVELLPPKLHVPTTKDYYWFPAYRRWCIVDFSTTGFTLQPLDVCEKGFWLDVRADGFTTSWGDTCTTVAGTWKRQIYRAEYQCTKSGATGLVTWSISRGPFLNMGIDLTRKVEDPEGEDGHVRKPGQPCSPDFCGEEKK